VIAAISLLASGRVPQKAEPMTQVSVSIAPLLYSPDTDRFANKPSSVRGRRWRRFPFTCHPRILSTTITVQLAPPRLPDNANHLLPITTTILDVQAPRSSQFQNDVGLPWMPDKTNSGGPGDRGIGAGKDGGMGDREGTGGGEGESKMPFARGVLSPSCAICPYPVYTDEARHAKVQGTVTLRVFVGPDGKASEIRVVRGVGFGLDERAVQTVRGWKFNPARDANQHASAAWVTIESVFRLF